MVRDILMYMDRTYVKQNQKRPVYEMGLAIFCQHCTRAPRVKERLQNLLLDLIKKERDGEKIDRDLVRSVAFSATEETSLSWRIDTYTPSVS